MASLTLLFTSCIGSLWNKLTSSKEISVSQSKNVKIRKKVFDINCCIMINKKSTKSDDKVSVNISDLIDSTDSNNSILDFI